MGIETKLLWEVQRLWANNSRLWVGICEDLVYRVNDYLFETCSGDETTFGEWCSQLNLDPERVWASCINSETGRVLSYEEGKKLWPLDRPVPHLSPTKTEPK